MCTDGPQGLCLSAGLAFPHRQLEGCPGQGPLRAPSTLPNPGAPVSLTLPPEGPDLTLCSSFHQACSAAGPQLPSRTWVFPSLKSPLFPSSPGSAQSKNHMLREFPGGSVVRTLYFPCGGHGFDPWSGN